MTPDDRAEVERIAPVNPAYKTAPCPSLPQETYNLILRRKMPRISALEAQVRELKGEVK